MGKNFVQKQYAEREAVLNIGISMGIQTACDYVAIALHDSEVMKGDPMGEERITRILKAAIAQDERFHKAFLPNDPEADYAQEVLDRELKEIYGSDFSPFAERYPKIKKVKY